MSQKLSESEKKKEDWMNSKWRPMMGWMYMIVCMFDFVLFPIMWSMVQALAHGTVNIQWQPITLQGAGLFHIAMGAIIGVSAYGRTQEKLGGANNGGIDLPLNVGSTYQIPGAVPQSGPGAFGAPATATFTQSWGSQPQSGSFTPAPSWGTTNVGITTGFGGKPAPPQPDFYPER
jgi:Holin of 3TMs, for gene-transfer release